LKNYGGYQTTEEDGCREEWGKWGVRELWRNEGKVFTSLVGVIF